VRGLEQAALRIDQAELRHLDERVEQCGDLGPALAGPEVILAAPDHAAQSVVTVIRCTANAAPHGDVAAATVLWQTAGSRSIGCPENRVRYTGNAIATVEVKKIRLELHGCVWAYFMLKYVPHCPGVEYR